MNVTNRIALIARDNDRCSFEQKIRNAQQAQALGVVVYSDEGQPLIDMNCADCAFYPSIPASMITYEDGSPLADSTVAGNFVTLQVRSGIRHELFTLVTLSADSFLSWPQ